MNSFEKVVRSELPSLLRLASSLSGDPDHARDLVQEVLVRAYEKWDRIGNLDRPGAYLMRMTTNEYLSWRRRWNTRSVAATADDSLERASPTLRDHGDRIADRDDIERRLSRLPRRQRAALVLRFYAQLDYAEMAEWLGCTEGSARSAVSRGLAALRLHQQSTVSSTRLDFT